MSLWESVSLVFLKIGNLKLGRNHNIWNQTKILHILTEDFLTPHSFQFFLHRINPCVKPLLQIAYSIISCHTVGMINLPFLLLSSMNQWCCISHSSLRSWVTSLEIRSSLLTVRKLGFCGTWMNTFIVHKWHAPRIP